MNDLGTASVAALRQYIRAAQASGVDSHTLLRTAGLNHDILDSDEGRISGQQLQEVIRQLAECSQNPVLGLETGDFVQPGSYSVLGYITMSCATLGDAVTRIARYEKLVGDMGVTTVQDRGELVRLTWSCNYDDPIVRPQLVDNVFASWINYARWLAEPLAASPKAVFLQRPSPGDQYLESYQQRWQCQVSFQANENAIEFAKSLLQVPLRQPDPLLRHTLELHADRLLSKLDDASGLVGQAKDSIRHHLLQGISRQDLIAERLGMTSRTLQRKLSQEGTSYQRLLDQARQEMAEDYLSNSELPIPEIALRLGYSETTSFHRKFKGTTGKTPGEFRQARQQTR